MSTVVTLNGASYVIPSTGEVGWGNNVSSYLIAVAAGVLQKTGGSFTLSAETDFGSSFGLKALYLKSETANIASSGFLRLANNSDSISFRNAANSANLPLAVNASDQLTFNGTPIGGTGIFTANRAIITDGSGNLIVSPTTATEIGFVSGVTSSIQTQLNGKQPTLTVGNLSDVGTDGIVVTGGTGSVIGSGTSLAQHVADSTHNGYLSSVDWSTFNSKQAALNTLTNHDILVGNGAGNVTLIPPSTAGFVLTSNGASSDPTFQAVSGSGTVNSGTTPRIAYYATTGNAVSDAADIEVIGVGQLRLTAPSDATSSELFLRNHAGGGLDITANSVSVSGSANGHGLGNSQFMRADNQLLVGAYSGTPDAAYISIGINDVEKILINDNNITATAPIVESTGTSDATTYIVSKISSGGGTATNAGETAVQSTTGVTTTGSTIITVPNENGYMAQIYGFDGSAAQFHDVVVFDFSTASAAPTVLVSRTVSGSPAARTYSVPVNNTLKLTMASGTYSIRIRADGISFR